MTQAIRPLPHPPTDSPLPAWPLVARDTELAAVLAALGRRARPAGAVLAGPAGSGRSRLAMAAISASGHDPATCWVTGTAAAARVPLGAFAPLLPQLAPATVPDGARLQRMAVTLRARGTTVLAVDDAHLLDDASAALLHHLALRCGVAVLATVRSGVPAPDAVTALWKDGHLQRVDLPAPDATDVRDLVEAALDGQVERRASTSLWELTGGDLVLLRQLVADEVADGRLRCTAGVWLWSGRPVLTPRLGDLIDAHVGAVPAAAQRAAALIATAGPLELGVLEELAGPDAVEAADGCGLLAVDDAARPAVRLALPLYGVLLTARAGAAHRMRMRTALATVGRAGTGDAAHPTDTARRDIEHGRAALRQGQVRAAARLLRDARAVLTLHGPAADGTSATTAAAELACALGMLGDATGATEAAGAAQGDPAGLLALAWAAAATGSVSEAVRHAHRAAAAARVSGDGETEVGALHTAVRFGDVAAAPRLAELADQAGPAVAHVTALAAHDGAGLDAVSQCLQRDGALLLAADAAAQAALAHGHRDARQAAIASAARAAELSRTCGGALTPALRAAARPLPLTRREHEVVMLAASGMSNKDIAARLVVSVRTVEGHLYRAGGKLHAGTRTELVALVGANQVGDYP
ncbi:helix-turn-helix transcriptional regulator [Pseudonocardia sp. GCM10023141]|uniref:helix-turn-helix transcriptional regulator n=1 Tax=Pseudonocardia sp. GCM10023141 TaxID=3252653 RepID=UPI00361DDB44